MLKLTKTGIGLLTKQYRSVLKKCLLLNLGLFLLFPENASAGSVEACLTYGGTITNRGYDWNGSTYTVDCYFSEKPSGIETSFMCTKFGCGYYANLGYGVVGPYSSLDTNYGHYIDAPSMYASYPYVKYSTLENFIRLDTEISATNTNLSNLTNELHNYYYTFRVDERIETIEFTKELRSNKKEMSLLDFMPIKAEDPLTFSVKTRDDSLDLMEVCHA